MAGIEQERHAGGAYAICFNSSTHLPPSAGSSTEAGDIAARRRARGEAAAGRIGYGHKHDWNCWHLAGKRSTTGVV